MAVPHAPMQEQYLLTQHKYYAPIPILLEIILFINKESGNLGQCAVLYGGVGNEILRRLFYLFRQCNYLRGAAYHCAPQQGNCWNAMG